MPGPTLELIEAARDGSLTQRRIHDFQQAGGNVNEKASNGLTLLSAASMGGSEGAVRSLLKFNANVNLASNHNCTPLWFATRILNQKKAYRVVNQLLNAGADVDVCSDPTMIGSTPLVNALRANQGQKVTSLLLAKKASPDFPKSGAVREQSNAAAVAAFLGNKIYEEKFQSKDVEELKPSRQLFVNGVQEILGLVAAVVNKFTSNSLQKTVGVKGKSKDNPVLDGEKFDSEVFQKGLRDKIATSGVSAFFPANSTFLNDVIAKADTFARQGTSALASPEYLPGLSHLSLYQPIIFCDNSGSMNTGSRIDDMIEIVARIAEITTHLVPDEEGMVIRFLNSYRTEAELYRKYGKIRTAKEATSMISAAKYDRDTRLGAHLEADVLKPYIYDFIDNGKKLERPLLISIITDGCPNDDAEHQLSDMIIKCKKRLEEKDFDPRIVSFQISQIGADDGADKFLRGLQNNPDIKNYIHITAGKLDEEFNKFNDNEDELEIYLFNTLMAPILRA